MVEKEIRVMFCEECPRDFRGQPYYEVYTSRKDLDEHVKKEHMPIA